MREQVKPDVLLGGTVEIHEVLARAGKLAEFAPLPDPDRIATYDDPRKHWTPLYLGYLAIVHRPLPSLAESPPNWATLVQPRWTGRVSIPSPSKSGGGLVFLATQLMRRENSEAGWQYLRLLEERGVRYEERSSLPIQRVGAGTMDLGVAWAHDIVRRRDEERLPVELHIPEQTGYEVGGVSILAWSDQIGAAEKFVNFLSGSRAGEIQASHGRRVPLRLDVEPPTYLMDRAQGGDARLMRDRTAFYDRQRVLSDRSAWLTRWAKESGGSR